MVCLGIVCAVSQLIIVFPNFILFFYGSDQTQMRSNSLDKNLLGKTKKTKTKKKGEIILFSLTLASPFTFKFH